MSSTILYLAIVAIWAGVLVPRWLRREPNREARPRSPSASSGEGGAAEGYAADGEDGGSAGQEVPVSGSGRSVGAREHSRHVPGARDGARGRRRGGVMAARRRLFGVLVTLFAAATAAAVVGLAGWWVVLPPAGMLVGYLMLLREAARADAERRARRVQRQRVAAPAGSGAHLERGARLERDAHLERGAGGAASAAVAFQGAEEMATARVIDLTAHVSDEPYDQDADAKLRAVGD